MIHECLRHLEALVACDTTNPPRRIAVDDAVVRQVVDHLGGHGFDVTILDLGEGCINVFAVRGTPRIVFNCHLDTVPAGSGWTHNPFKLHALEDRVIGLGVCDIKGAAACLLAAVTRHTGSAALLFTTDEEAGQSVCVRSFLTGASSRFARAIVAEPTDACIRLAHRGILSAEVIFSGRAGHASLSENHAQSAVHDAVRWASRALAWSAQARDAGHDLSLNIGTLQGGTKPNVVADRAEIRFGLRPHSGQQTSSLLDELRALHEGDCSMEMRLRFTAPALACSASMKEWTADLDPVTAPLPYWTEAALFAEAGLPSAVLGPGNIEQAHAPDEWVPLVQLERCAELYLQLLRKDDCQ